MYRLLQTQTSHVFFAKDSLEASAIDMTDVSQAGGMGLHEERDTERIYAAVALKT